MVCECYDGQGGKNKINTSTLVHNSTEFVDLERPDVEPPRPSKLVIRC